MNNEELKKKICDIIAPYVSAWGDDERIANALIAAGIGDVKESENKATAAELVAQVSASTAIEKIAEWKHRAEVAELVVKNLNDIFTFDYQAVFEQAEKELAEEKKDANRI